MRRFIILSLATLIAAQICLAPLASAKVYTWKDRNGVIRRTYYPPPPEQVWKDRQTPARVNPSQKKSANRVELYVTSWCPYCKKAETFFRSRGINYTVYDIEKDGKAAARKKNLDKSGGGVPFAVINGKMISGYAPEMYSRALR